MITAETKRIREIPLYKIEIVAELAKKMRKIRTILVASTKKLPSSQFHEIKKNLRGKAEINVVKKSLALRALAEANKPGLKKLENNIVSDIAIFLSALDPFELSALLAENQSPLKAKAGDIAPADITVEPGPTNLVPGPAISELSSVGLKVAVEGGKLTIKQSATIVHAGEVIKENAASVMGKLGITPMKVGFEPISAYDSETNKIYENIIVDKNKTLELLRSAFQRALSFAVQRNYISKETLGYLLARAAREEHALINLFEKSSNQNNSSHNKNIKEGI